MKIYSEPITKVVTVNVKAICETTVKDDSKPTDEGTTTEAPLF